MKIIYVIPENLSPLNSGGRLGIYRELESLLDFGHELLCIMFVKDLSDPIPNLESKGNKMQLVVVKQKSFLKSTLSNPFVPFQVSSRRLTNSKLSEILNLAVDYDLILANHDWTVPVAKRIQTVNRVPIILRSHNDEFEFLMSLFKNEPRLTKKFYYFLEAIRYRLVRSNIERNIKGVISISKQTHEKYSRRGIVSNYCGPSFGNYTSKQQPPLSISKKGNLSIGFLGSLDMAHNVKGLVWFFEKVFPKIISEIPEANVLIGGRRAPENFTKYVRHLPSTVFLGEIADPADFYSNIGISINPILSGSGVNIKLVDSLKYQVPMVSTTFGIRGFEAISDLIHHSNRPEDVSTICINLLKDPDLRESTLRSQELAARLLSNTSISKSVANMFHT